MGIGFARDIAAAFGFLTVLPLRAEPRRPGAIFVWFPLVGLVIGVLLTLIASNTTLPRDMTAFLVLVVWVVLTGGLHLDGLADFCDGVLATTSRERRLAIMKDPQAGTWAVVGLVLLLLGKWLALREDPAALLILPPVLGRWMMVIAAYGFPYARADGIGGHFRDGLGRAQVAIATVIALIIFAVLALSQGGVVLVAVAGGALAALLVAVWTARRLGGLTGDVYGALCEITELVSLWLLVI